MKQITVRVDEDLHKELKIWAIVQGKTVTDLIVTYIKSGLETAKKEESQTPSKV